MTIFADPTGIPCSGNHHHIAGLSQCAGIIFQQEYATTFCLQQPFLEVKENTAGADQVEVQCVHML